jgi:N,N-dimethylformamidase beta subunit-like, C-terminal
VIENHHPGTRAWRLSGPPQDVGGLRSGDVAGYVADQAVTPGQTERIYVSAPGSASVRITVFRIGWYGGAGGREVLVSEQLPIRPQPRCTHRYATGLTECDWRPTLSLVIPPAVPSGVYIARLTARTGQSDCLFVIRARASTPLLAQLPTSTYEAYNAWGGDSLYPGGADPVGLTNSSQGVEVSYDRPYDSVTGAGQFFARDVAMVWFLEQYGYPVSYTTSESVDEDPGQLLGRRALLDFGHSEYWSQRQANAFVAARNAGTNLLFLSSDTLAWRVRYAPASAAASEAGQPDHSLVSYKEHAALDPNRSSPTGAFPDRGAPLTGSAYLGCITPRLNVTGPPTYRYYAWTPAPGLQPHWLFARTGITAATQIPGVVGYELDMRTAASPPRTMLVGRGTAPCMPAGAGEPSPGPGQDRAEATLYTAPSGAVVFSSGTLGWELGLEPVPSASPDAPRSPDPRLVALTRNLLAHVLGH